MVIKKFFKSLLIVAFAIFLIIVIADNSKYFWKMFNTLFCENPENITVHSVVNNYASKVVEIKGSTLRDRYYTDYVYWTDTDGNMYIGLKYNKYMGYSEKTKEFDLKLSYTNKKINRVYIVCGTGEKKVWPTY